MVRGTGLSEPLGKLGSTYAGAASSLRGATTRQLLFGLSTS